ncbi:efflux RND transporter periplasmic adaptor subunit [Pseudoalteromonas denitrificans]|uniref:Membrane fusion protein, cobalt-zinc-cadmium efflux system n=1 Tax=Pseudoalteromonas denitrificans DSM 6059 TaxID=1123010 RepID=A0A1I1TNZ7_9GAMM|nr:efflux RND transporter periplasmic adaptor subunit [Pseudoalteromonas denitrificans]SFD60381.1 membrane fusion protein, cobalt-zinc-cadmium efflux system [Pseudoalteromonas denitrificans DSM 6059]
MNTKYVSSFLILSLFLGVTLLSLFSTQVYASNKDKHTEHHAETDEHNSDVGHVKISLKSASAAGITSITAHSGEIKQTIKVYGKSVLDPKASSQIRARFPGMITQLTPNIGDIVKKGTVIGEIESNSSLKRYKITSPISGIVTSRNLNPGELADEQVLLTIANYDKLWVELRLFSSQVSKISKGQKVLISSNNTQTTSVIKHLLPNNSNQPFIIARVPLDNTQQVWSPGLLVSGSIVVNKIQAPIVVDNRAIQVIETNKVVFVKNETGFEKRQLTFGQTDGAFTEVLSGLQLGEQYAVENSYLLKADLGKSSASHAH